MEDYTILFDRLAEASADAPPSVLEATTLELDEIAELRRAVLEITQPAPTAYTTT
jgi:hypothetical protein